MREKLRQYLKNEGVTQLHIAKKLNVSTTLISLYLKNERNLSDKKEAELAEFLKSKTI
ncbi:MAG: helix-turn-helix domain-containing protein [Tissierellaceae bacterium]|nr:helix-turn-helix domain-containing protein [Tissierellaceae bacterium]